LNDIALLGAVYIVSGTKQILPIPVYVMEIKFLTNLG
jgi:hypothetical protein